mmetsp:Transcript_59050/g.127745  ORF Transcript_59050/g.127745 Transcript_59050/m.127745 type:complete len:412 (-) Transcript_59050:68-1303(-)
MAGKRDALKAVFQKYDKDQNGSISRSELEDLLHAIKIDSGDLSAFFTHIDKNHDGVIQYEEFVDWLYEKRGQFAVAGCLVPPSEGGIEDVFLAFCGSGHSDMDGKCFAKLCKDCGLLDRKCTPTDVDLIFAKVVAKGHRRIVFAEFEMALHKVAEKKGVDFQDIEDKVVCGGGPVLHGTKADAVRFHDDKSTYTGTHVNGGPDHVAKGQGSAHSSLGPAALRHDERHSSTGSNARRTSATTVVATQRPSRVEAHEAFLAMHEAPQAQESLPQYKSLDATWMAYTKGQDMDGKTFAKLCKDCELLDKKCTPTDVDLIFAKVAPKGQRRIHIGQFEAALELLANKKGKSVDEVRGIVTEHGGPELHGTQAEAVRFHDDKSTYTGVHQHGGPESVAVGAGTASQLASRGMGVGF